MDSKTQLHDAIEQTFREWKEEDLTQIRELALSIINNRHYNNNVQKFAGVIMEAVRESGEEPQKKAPNFIWEHTGQKRAYGDSHWIGTLIFSEPTNVNDARDAIDAAVHEGRVKFKDEGPGWYEPYYNELIHIAPNMWRFHVQRMYLD